MWASKLKINIYWDYSRHWRCTVLSCMCLGAFIKFSCSQVFSGNGVNFETLVFTFSLRDLWCECKSLLLISSTLSLVITLTPCLSLTVTTKSLLYLECFNDSNWAFAVSAVMWVSFICNFLCCRLRFCWHCLSPQPKQCHMLQPERLKALWLLVFCEVN